MLCQASANVLAGAAVGASREEIELVSAGLTAMLKSDDKIACPSPGWEPLALFEPVAKYKSRHGCVTLPFKALLEAFT
jgi:nitrogen fixation NifU-like protein